MIHSLKESETLLNDFPTKAEVNISFTISNIKAVNIFGITAVR